MTSSRGFSNNLKSKLRINDGINSGKSSIPDLS
eukprot:CAMPEP_0168315788 /NCGR_PEP_ID=MMETSP0210-20121227/12670_1 /TAXON_ID=40633 /ORGANISM="Condylostoma magnum, Strain COL2" /LENGTH=32 /DNA_ID= /DNA_START= /DNA_END= /DNA_ORIENTATION=